MLAALSAACSHLHESSQQQSPATHVRVPMVAPCQPDLSGGSSKPATSKYKTGRFTVTTCCREATAPADSSRMQATAATSPPAMVPGQAPLIVDVACTSSNAGGNSSSVSTGSSCTVGTVAISFSPAVLAAVAATSSPMSSSCTAVDNSHRSVSPDSGDAFEHVRALFSNAGMCMEAATAVQPGSSSSLPSADCGLSLHDRSQQSSPFTANAALALMAEHAVATGGAVMCINKEGSTGGLLVQRLADPAPHCGQDTPSCSPPLPSPQLCASASEPAPSSLRPVVCMTPAASNMHDSLHGGSHADLHDIQTAPHHQEGSSSSAFVCHAAATAAITSISCKPSGNSRFMRSISDMGTPDASGASTPVRQGTPPLSLQQRRPFSGCSPVNTSLVGSASETSLQAVEPGCRSPDAWGGMPQPPQVRFYRRGRFQITAIGSCKDLLLDILQQAGHVADAAAARLRGVVPTAPADHSTQQTGPAQQRQQSSPQAPHSSGNLSMDGSACLSECFSPLSSSASSGCVTAAFELHLPADSSQACTSAACGPQVAAACSAGQQEGSQKGFIKMYSKGRFSVHECREVIPQPPPRTPRPPLPTPPPPPAWKTPCASSVAAQAARSAVPAWKSPCASSMAAGAAANGTATGSASGAAGTSGAAPRVCGTAGGGAAALHVSSAYRQPLPAPPSLAHVSSAPLLWAAAAVPCAVRCPPPTVACSQTPVDDRLGQGLQECMQASPVAVAVHATATEALASSTAAHGLSLSDSQVEGGAGGGSGRGVIRRLQELGTVQASGVRKAGRFTIHDSTVRKAV